MAYDLFSSPNTTLRAHLMQPKDAVDLRKQDGIVYKIPCECHKVYIGKWEGTCMNRLRSTIGIP